MSMAFMDIETFSTVPIRSGTWAYAEGAEVLLWAYALGEGPVKVWDLTTGAPMPADLAEMLADDDVVTCWHNGGMFDTVVLKLVLGIDLPLRRVHDTLVQAMAHSLPGSLGQLCDILRVDTDKAKDKIGKELIRLFCSPPGKHLKRGRATRETHPAEWARFVDYAALDISAMREVYRKMPKWNLTPTEVALWHLDQGINRRGMCMDTDLAQAAVRAVDIAQADLRGRTMELTNGEVESSTKRDAMLLHVLAEYGVDLPDLQKSTIERRAQDPDLPEGLRELLRIRLQASSTSTTKYRALLNSVSSDGRLRGTKQFCGAGRTGRWAGRLFQPDNLPRPALKQDDIDFGIEALKDDTAHLLFDNVMELTSSAIRGCIVASPGNKLVVADLSNIEGRGVAWLAGERWKLKAFRDFDTIVGQDDKGDPIRLGQDLYKMAYAASFGIKPEEVTKDQRQVGKVQELACLGPNTLVLTDKLGYIPIQDLTTEVQVWDGREWVKHKGVISRGERETLNMAGLEVTPDHLILTGETWKQAQQLASRRSMQRLALATGSVNLPSSAFVSVPLAGVPALSTSTVHVAKAHTACTATICVAEKAPGAVPAPGRKLAQREKTFGRTQTSCRPTTTGAGYLIEYLRASTGAPIQTIKVTPTTAAGASLFTRLGWRVAANTSHISSHLTGGTKLTLNWIESMSIGAMSRAICASYRTARIRVTAERFAACKTPSSGSNRKMPTFDLLLAGPRNCFTVLTDKGPLIVHNCGYEGGVGAFVTFAAAYNIVLDDLAERAIKFIPSDVMAQSQIMLQWHRSKGRDPAARLQMADRTWLVCESFVLGWRAGHREVAAYWKELDACVRAAIDTPGTTIPCGKVRIRRDGAWLRIVLPSGRALCYPSPQLQAEKRKKEDTEVIGLEALESEQPATGRTKITYMGMNQYTRKWDRLDTYGGKIFENICQAVARDVMAHNMPAIEAAGYAIVLTVHDEIIAEAPDSPEYNAEHLASLLATNPPWAPDMPLAAAGFESYRYKKD